MNIFSLNSFAIWKNNKKCINNSADILLRSSVYLEIDSYKKTNIDVIFIHYFNQLLLAIYVINLTNLGKYMGFSSVTNYLITSHFHSRFEFQMSFIWL